MTKKRFLQVGGSGGPKRKNFVPLVLSTEFIPDAYEPLKGSADLSPIGLRAAVLVRDNVFKVESPKIYFFGILYLQNVVPYVSWKKVTGKSKSGESVTFWDTLDFNDCIKLWGDLWIILGHIFAYECDFGVILASLLMCDVDFGATLGSLWGDFRIRGRL